MLLFLLLCCQAKSSQDCAAGERWSGDACQPADSDSVPAAEEDSAPAGGEDSPQDSSPPEGVDSESSDSQGSDSQGRDSAPASTEPLQVLPSDPRLSYRGRILDAGSDQPGLYWPGSSIHARFEGSSLSLTFEDSGENWIQVLVDDEEPLILQTLKGEQSYLIADTLSPGEHSLEIHKRTETFEGSLIFRGLELGPGSRLLDPPEAPELRMEFYGDSITSGYSVDCECDSGEPEYKNNYLTYAGYSARALGAEYRSISLSGVGIVQSWWDATIYDYWDSLYGSDHAWNFKSWTPHVVVVNLGQNDKWLGVGAEITDAYVDFGQRLRSAYPEAELFFALGSMDAVAPGSPFPGYLEAAVERLRLLEGREDVHAVVFPYNGSGKHPVAAEQEQMSAVLVDAIRAAMPELP